MWCGDLLLSKNTGGILAGHTRPEIKRGTAQAIYPSVSSTEELSRARQVFTGGQRLKRESRFQQTQPLVNPRLMRCTLSSPNRRTSFAAIQHTHTHTLTLSVHKARSLLLLRRLLVSTFQGFGSLPHTGRQAQHTRATYIAFVWGAGGGDGGGQRVAWVRQTNRVYTYSLIRTLYFCPSRQLLPCKWY